MQGLFDRAELLFGKDVMCSISDARVLLVGTGGVGSWCAESLIRTGIQHLTMVDFDDVNVSNVNRQLMATTKTIGKKKVEVLKERLLEINPDAEITAVAEYYTDEKSADFHLDKYDYIIDCIDSLKDKVALLVNATKEKRPQVFSSMGAALKVDPTKVQVAEFWKVRGCPLGSAMRTRLRKSQLTLSKKVRCVFSEELLQNKTKIVDEVTGRQTNGSLVHITAIYGFTIAGLVIQDIVKKHETKENAATSCD